MKCKLVVRSRNCSTNNNPQAIVVTPPEFTACRMIESSGMRPPTPRNNTPAASPAPMTHQRQQHHRLHHPVIDLHIFRRINANHAPVHHRQHHTPAQSKPSATASPSPPALAASPSTPPPTAKPPPPHERSPAPSVQPFPAASPPPRAPPPPVQPAALRRDHSHPSWIRKFQKIRFAGVHRRRAFRASRFGTPRNENPQYWHVRSGPTSVRRIFRASVARPVTFPCGAKS